MINEHSMVAPAVSKEEWMRAKCDKYDYMIAAFCGGIAGLVDVFL